MVVGEQSRDESMAENTTWWVDQLGPESKVVLWAHNFHVSVQPGAQGGWLRDTYGGDMVVFAFGHELGTFTAVTQFGATYYGLRQHDLNAMRDLSYESYFATTESPRFFLDLRSADRSTSASSWLTGPRSFRSIGCCYDRTRPNSYWARISLPAIFHVVIHIRQTRPTVVLTAQYPDVFEP